MADPARPPGRRLRRLVTVVVIAAVLSPAVRDRDSFPLSTYPMYATARGATIEVSTVVGAGRTGAVHRLSLRVIAATDDPLVAESAVDRAIAAGDAAGLCAEVASRVGTNDGRTFDELAVVTEELGVDDYAAGRPALVRRTEHARCPVPS